MKPTPTLYLRKERPAVIAISSDNADADADVASPINGNVSVTAAASDNYNDDGREYVDDIDLVKKLKATEYSTHLSSGVYCHRRHHHHHHYYPCPYFSSPS